MGFKQGEPMKVMKANATFGGGVIMSYPTKHKFKCKHCNRVFKTESGLEHHNCKYTNREK